MIALAFVYLGSVAVAAPIHMLDAGVTSESVTPFVHADEAHGDSHAGDLPEAPHEHEADCLTCGLLTLPGADAVAAVPSHVPGVADLVFAPRGLALTDRAVVNPRLRGPPVT